MKNEIARREIESLDYYLQNHTNDYSEESHTAMMMAIKALEQEPKSEWQHDHEILKAYSDGANEVLDKIRAEIANNLQIMDICNVEKVNDVIVQSELANRKVVLYDSVMQIIDKYKTGEA